MTVNWKKRRAALKPTPASSQDDRQHFTRTQSLGVSVGVTTTQILNQNPTRKFASIVNDGPNAVYISFSDKAAMNAGIRLNANGGVVVFGLLTDLPYTGSVSGISSVANNVTVMES